MFSSWNPFRKDPKELVRKWKANIRSEVRRTDREMALLVLEQRKAAKSIKEAAGRNDMASARVSTCPTPYGRLCDPDAAGEACVRSTGADAPPRRLFPHWRCLPAPLRRFWPVRLCASAPACPASLPTRPA